MNRAKVCGAGIAVALAVLGVAVGVAVLVTSRGSEAREAAPLVSGERAAVNRIGRPDPDMAIAFWQKRIRKNPSGYIDLTYLGEASAQKARATGDIGLFQRAEEAAQKALQINPRYFNASALLANVKLSLHDFTGALATATPLAANPRTPQALATVGDAHLALGDYDAAKAAYDKLYERFQTPAVLSRLASLADLEGRTDEAISFMSQAAKQAERSAEPAESLAWYELQVGELYWRGGRIDVAEAHYRTALELFPSYYLALGGLGKVEAAKSRYDEAIGFYQRATEIVPQPELLAALGDVYRASGKETEAQLQYDTVEYIGKLVQINRQVYNRALASFYADHDLKLDEALRLATSELAARKDVYGYDAAAWASYKNGQLEQAGSLIEQALALGTRDARLLYHAGMIANGLGRAADAKRFLSEALDVNPHFDLLQAPIAKATLARLD